MTFGIIVAVIGALSFAAASVLQALGAERVAQRAQHRTELRSNTPHPTLRSTAATMLTVPFLVGFVFDIVGFVATIVSARLIPLFLSQTIISARMVATAVLAAIADAPQMPVPTPMSVRTSRPTPNRRPMSEAPPSATARLANITGSDDAYVFAYRSLEVHAYVLAEPVPHVLYTTFGVSRVASSQPTAGTQTELTMRVPGAPALPQQWPADVLAHAARDEIEPGVGERSEHRHRAGRPRLPDRLDLGDAAPPALAEGAPGLEGPEEREAARQDRGDERVVIGVGLGGGHGGLAEDAVDADAEGALKPLDRLHGA